LTSVTIPDSVTSVGSDAFSNCGNVTNIAIGNGVTSIGLEAFFGTNPTNVVIPVSVTYIGEDAFEYCYGLTNVFFQSNAPIVGEGAFLGENPMAYYLPGTTGWTAFSTNADLSVMLWNPVIQTGVASFGLSNNQFGFNIAGTTNIPIVVEACANLASPVWTALTNTTLTNGSYFFSEPLQANSSGRFYRISAP
jgi:hypothetical protein